MKQVFCILVFLLSGFTFAQQQNFMLIPDNYEVALVQWTRTGNTALGKYYRNYITEDNDVAHTEANVVAKITRSTISLLISGTLYNATINKTALIVAVQNDDGTISNQQFNLVPLATYNKNIQFLNARAAKLQAEAAQKQAQEDKRAALERDLQSLEYSIESNLESGSQSLEEIDFDFIRVDDVIKAFEKTNILKDQGIFYDLTVTSESINKRYKALQSRLVSPYACNNQSDIKESFEEFKLKVGAVNSVSVLNEFTTNFTEKLNSALEYYDQAFRDVLKLENLIAKNKINWFKSAYSSKKITTRTQVQVKYTKGFAITSSQINSVFAHVRNDGEAKVIDIENQLIALNCPAK